MEEEPSTTPSTASLSARIGRRRSPCGRARRCARASKPAHAALCLSDLSLCCVQIDRRDRHGGGGICGRGRRPFRPLVERGSVVGGQRRSALVRPAQCDRQAAQAVSPSRGTLFCSSPCALRVCSLLTSAGSSCSTAAPSAEPCTSRAAAFVCADVVSMCECLVIPTSGGASCLCAQCDVRATRAWRGERMSF